MSNVRLSGNDRWELIDRSRYKYLERIGFSRKEILRVIGEYPLLKDNIEDGITWSPFSELDKRFFFVFFSRSGSTYLCRLLETIPEFGKIREHFRNPRFVGKAQKFNSKTVAKTASLIVKDAVGKENIFGFKGASPGFVRLAQLGELPEKAHEWQWIFLRRRNVVAQAVSMKIAGVTGQFHSPSPVVPNTVTDEDYNFEAIERAVAKIEKQNQNFERFFKMSGVPYLELVYEDYTKDIDGTLTRVYNFLGFEGKPKYDESLVKFTKLFSDTNQRWIDRYLLDKERNQ